MAVYICTPEQLSFRNGSLFGALTKVRINPYRGIHPLSKPEWIPLSKLNFIWMRKDPPVDAAYYQTCQLLTTLPPAVSVINNPKTLIAKNEKLFALEFKKWAPKTVISRQTKDLISFLKELGGKMVVKPLASKGGEGVRLVYGKDPLIKKRLLNVTEEGKRLCVAQEFLPKALSHGDKRIVLVDGKPLGAFLRPPTPDTLSGKTVPFVKDLPAQLTEKEKQLCDDLCPVLKKSGLFFVGIDVIDNRLIEINFTSPAGIPELNHLYGKSFEESVINHLIRKSLRGNG